MYLIVGTSTFSSQANRDAARTRLDTAIAAVTHTDFTTTFTAGIVHPTTTSLTISIKLDTNDDSIANTAYKSLYDALIQSNRPTSCYVSVYRTGGGLFS